MKITKKTIIIALPILIIIMGIFGAGGYHMWNTLSPTITCASCHEIQPTIHEWLGSAHQDMKCTDCHGTAMSEGLTSLKEKTGMIITHLTSKPENYQIKMTESQVLAVTQRCISCHQTEGAKWNAGRHSTTYADIFLDEKHNKMESPYWDCFRCHGMHYDGDINDLMQRPDSIGAEWKMIDEDQADVTAITCLACHKVHTDNPTLAQSLADGVNDPDRNTPLHWYMRTDEMHIRADMLQNIEMVDAQGARIEVSDDPAFKLCVQCHSPNTYHQAGTEDDRTPVGVHEGLSCIACHDPHSGSSQDSCLKCHSESSNGGVDVRTLDTSYLNPESKNNIHYITEDTFDEI